jgi:hypothetical protein
MAQIRQDFVNVTNGAAYVDSTNTLTDWSTVAPGHLFTVEGDGALYTIASVLLPGPAGVPRITLTAPYGGLTATAVAYAITTDFTPNLNLPLINRGDIETGELYSDAMTKIDEIQAGAGVTKTYVDEADANLQNQIDANEDTIADLIPNEIALGNIQGSENLFDNSDMWFWQRGFDVWRVISITAGQSANMYGADRWQLRCVGAYAVQMRTQIDQAGVPSGIPYRNRILRVIAPTAKTSFVSSDLCMMRQVIEGPRLHLAIGLPMVLTGLIYVSRAGTSYMCVRLWGTLADGSKSVACMQELTLQAGWNQISLFYKATPAFYTTPNNAALICEFWMGAGSDSNQGVASPDWVDFVGTNATTARQTNFFDVVNYYVQFWGLCLRSGNLVIPFHANDVCTELPKVQRYFCKSYDSDVNAGTVTNVCAETMIEESASYAYGKVNFPVAMRLTPLVTIYNPSTGAVNSVRQNTGALNLAVSNVYERGEGGFNGIAISGGTATNGRINLHYTAEVDF